MENTSNNELRYNVFGRKNVTEICIRSTYHLYLTRCYVFKLLKIEKHDASLQLELSELQINSLYLQRKTDVCFETKLFVEKYPLLRDFALKMLCK